MKKLLVVMLMLAMASVANAALQLEDVGGSISITGDGSEPVGYFFLGVEAGGSLNIMGATIVYPGSQTAIYEMEEPDLAALMNVNNPFVYIELNDTPPSGPVAPLNGILVTGIVGSGTIKLFDQSAENMLASIVIVPEPMTMVLLGLGGLMLRRRK
jgi:hypothetical protein